MMVPAGARASSFEMICRLMGSLSGTLYHLLDMNQEDVTAPSPPQDDLPQ